MKTRRDYERIRDMLQSQERVSEIAWEMIQKKQAEMVEQSKRKKETAKKAVDELKK